MTTTAEVNLTKIAEDVCAALSGAWALVPTEDDYGARHWRSIRLDQGQAEVSVSHRDGRLWWTGQLPRAKHGGSVLGLSYRDGARESVPSISTAVDRAPAAIAKDLERRLLPDYLRMLAVGLQQKAEAEAYQKRTLENARALAAAFGGCKMQENTDGECAVWPHLPNDISADARVSGSYVRFDRLSVPPAVALKLAALLMECAREGADDGAR